MQTPGYDGWQLPLPPPPLTGICGVLLGCKITKGVNVGGGVAVRVCDGMAVAVEVCVYVREGVAEAVAVGVCVREGVAEAVGVSVFVCLLAAVGIEAMNDEAVALTDETNCAPINNRASSMPTALRESKDLLI